MNTQTARRVGQDRESVRNFSTVHALRMARAAWLSATLLTRTSRQRAKLLVNISCALLPH
jgi:hypothetical protein